VTQIIGLPHAVLTVPGFVDNLNHHGIQYEEQRSLALDVVRNWQDLLDLEN